MAENAVGVAYHKLKNKPSQTSRNLLVFYSAAAIASRSAACTAQFGRRPKSSRRIKVWAAAEGISFLASWTNKIRP